MKKIYADSHGSAYRHAVQKNNAVARFGSVLKRFYFIPKYLERFTVIMHGFTKCFLYLASIGLLSFFIGRILPKEWFCYDHPPYRAFSFEKGGRCYDTLKIRKWKDLVPDMSRIFPKLIPSKKLADSPNAELIELMLQETCIAECIHVMLGILGFVCVGLWPGFGGWSIAFIFLVIGNIPFCLIQRYNRPKLVRLLSKLRARENRTTNEREIVQPQ